MRQHRLFATAVAALFAATITLQHSTEALAHEYVPNGGFEQGTDGWSFLSNGSMFDVEPDGVAALEGAHRGRVIVGPSNFRLNHSVENVPPGIYTVSISARIESSSALVRVDILTDPSIVPTFETVTFGPQPGVWQQHTAALTLPGASWVSLRLFGTGDVGDRIYIDDVHFEGASPATMTPTLTPTHTPTPPLPTATRTASASATAAMEPTSTSVPQAGGVYSGLQNGGFEDVSANNLPLAWSKYGGTLGITTSPVGSGSHAGTLESQTDSTKWMYQTVRVAHGSQYQFAASVWLEGEASAALLRISWYGSADGSGEAIAADDSVGSASTLTSWTRLETEPLLPPPGAQTAKLRILLQPRSAALASIVVDDAVFGIVSSAVPTPGEVAASNQSGDDPAEPIRRVAESDDAELSTGAAPPNVVVNEVLYDSLSTEDADGEWVELYNAGPDPVQLAGWRLADNRAADMLPEFLLQPRAYVVVAVGATAALLQREGVPLLPLSGSIGNGLGNEGDRLLLIDPSGRFVDTISWGVDSEALSPPVADVPAGHSVERVRPGVDTNGASDFVDNERPSPGRAYEAPEDANAPLPANPGRTTVRIFEGGRENGVGIVVWALVGGSLATLAVFAGTRLAPHITQRLRHG